METERYIITQAVIAKDKTIIPMWDDRIVFEKSKMFGNQIFLKGEPLNEYRLVECLYDLKTKKLEMGVEINYDPDKNKLDFKEGQAVFFEVSARTMAEAKIKKIVYEEFDIQILRGKKIEEYWGKRFNDVKIEADCLYAIKQWKPFYLLDNGKTIQYQHQLYMKEKQI